MLDAGSLAVLPFPFSGLRATKRRPVLLLTAPDGYGDFLAMAVTSQAGHPESLALNQSDMQAGTLPKASWTGSIRWFCSIALWCQKRSAKSAPRCVSKPFACSARD